MRKSKGITLLELMLVLAIIATVLVSIARLYEVVDNNRKVTEASNMILQIYQAGAQYAELPTSRDPNLNIEFCEKGYLSQNFCERRSNPWGGDFVTNKLSSNEMLVIATKVPLNLCNNLASKFKKMNNVDIDKSCDTKDQFQIIFYMDGKP